MKISGGLSKGKQISTKVQTTGTLHLFFDVPCFKAQNRKKQCIFSFQISLNGATQSLLSLFAEHLYLAKNITHQKGFYYLQLNRWQR